MGEIKRKDGNKEEQKSNIPVPSHDNSQKIEEGKEAKIQAAAEKIPGQQDAGATVILKETPPDKETKFEKWHLIIQIVLALIGICTVGAFIHFSSIQHEDSINFLKQAKESTDSSDVISKKSIAIAENSLKLTRENIRNQEKLARDEMRPYVYITKIGSLPIVTNKPTTFIFEMINAGKTPAISLLSHVIFTKDEDSLKFIATQMSDVLRKRRWRNEATLGTNIPMNRLVEDPIMFSQQDSINFVNYKFPIFMLIGIEYSDQFGERDSTWNCVIFDNQGKPRAYKNYNGYK